MKIDTHIHSSGISKCSHVTYKEIVEYKQKMGLDGVILTNHCQPWYYDENNYKEWMQSFLREYDEAYLYGKEHNFKFFLGIEITLTKPKYADYLLFGVTREFLENSDDFCALTQKELYNLCAKNNILLVQAHPLRGNIVLMDTKYLDGVEINLRPSDILKEDEIVKIGKKYNLFITVGTDYHDISQTDNGGMIIPDEINNSVELASYMRKTRKTEVFVNDKVTTYCLK